MDKITESYFQSTSMMELKGVFIFLFFSSSQYYSFEMEQRALQEYDVQFDSCILKFCRPDDKFHMDSCAPRNRTKNYYTGLGG